MLGAPVIKVELDEQNLDAAVDLALQVFEDYAPREYFNYYVFNTTPGKSVYTMPPDIGLIRNVFYKKQPSLTFNASDLAVHYQSNTIIQVVVTHLCRVVC